jgi:hypothetical protein
MEGGVPHGQRHVKKGGGGGPDRRAAAVGIYPQAVGVDQHAAWRHGVPGTGESSD